MKPVPMSFSFVSRVNERLLYCEADCERPADCMVAVPVDFWLTAIIDSETGERFSSADVRAANRDQKIYDQMRDDAWFAVFEAMNSGRAA